jgi:hypothetical protein
VPRYQVFNVVERVTRKFSGWFPTRVRGVSSSRSRGHCHQGGVRHRRIRMPKQRLHGRSSARIGGRTATVPLSWVVISRRSVGPISFQKLYLEHEFIFVVDITLASEAMFHRTVFRVSQCSLASSGLEERRLRSRRYSPTRPCRLSLYVHTSCTQLRACVHPQWDCSVLI